MAEPVDEWTDHLCTFDEVIIEEDDGPLRAGDKVLIPCRQCGETPLENMEFLDGRTREMDAALLAAMPTPILYHWAPATRRKAINHYGLRPWRAPSTSSVASPVVCFADSPSWAWALSGEQANSPYGDWDLWQTSLKSLTDPLVLASSDRLSGIHEVRTEHRVFKRDLWLAGTRTKVEGHRLRQVR